MNAKFRRIIPFAPLLILVGCQPSGAHNGDSISQSLEQYDPHRPRAAEQNHGEADGGSSEAVTSAASDIEGPVFWVNGKAVGARRFDRLLFESHGLFVLEQVLAIELVRQDAARLNITVTQAEIEREYDLSLIRMAKPVASNADDSSLLAAGAEMLREFLLRKNISLDEYMIGIERNVYLRKMVQPDIHISESEIVAEFDRRYGRKAVVRHIALRDVSTVGLIKRRLVEGADFADLARSFSSNRVSGENGGLLSPFTESDLEVPELIRQTAFALQPGQVSNAVHMDGEFHIFMLDGIIEPAATVMSPKVAEQLHIELTQRATNAAMERLAKRLFEMAEIRIEDPVLKEQFLAKHGEIKALTP